MSDKVLSLVSSGCLPDRIEQCLALAHWRKLEDEIRAGLPVGLTAIGGCPLFELILSAQENAPGGDAPLPLSLLDALITHGLTRGEIEGDRGMTAISLCAEYGQWAWMKRLIEEDFQVETAQWPALCAIGFGRHSRFSDWANRFSEDAPLPQKGNVVPLHTSSPSHACPIDQAWHEMSKETPAMRDAVLRLVAMGVDIDACPSNLMPLSSLVPQGAHRGGSALIVAIEKEDREYARVLVNAGADLNSIYATWMGEQSASLLTPLGSVIRNNWPDLVQSMLDTGGAMVPVPFTQDGQLGTMHPLRMLVCLDDDLDRTDILRLIASRMSKEDLVREGTMCMLQSAFSNKVDYLRALHAQGIGYDVRSVNGFQAIHQACSQGSEEAIEFLLANGARLDDVSNTGVSAASLLLDKPELARKFHAQEHTDNIRMFRRRK